ncbi:cytochrome-c peroxidase [Aquisphaera insulae]|uniref:cytochrome-c peroxidase n=1 Tax=Aquisphaera insulae TaxID=2712864 RepID=UPI00202E47F7|nr:cytochrome c peroxidase [Aquisphaera insulae]
MKKAQNLFPTLPKDAAKPDRPITPERVRLGKMLFFDPRTSGDGAVSCSRCHLPQLCATDALSKSIGAYDRHLIRNAPTIFNAAIHTSQHWDGRFVDVEDQAVHGLTGPGLGNPDDRTVEGRLAAIPGYPEAFHEAFPDDKDPVTARNFALAVGAFERTLIAPSRFDDYLAGKADALSAQETKGLKLFIETGCVDCHKGPGVGGAGFRKFGVFSDYRAATGTMNPDKGRFDLTKNPDDVDKFKIPGLRGVAVTPPYFHDGSVESLPKAIRIMAKIQLDTDLADTEVEAIAAFLGSLTGPMPADYDHPPVLPPGGYRNAGPSH